MIKGKEKKVWLKSIFLAFISGIIMALTVAPFNLFYLAWIALIPLWIMIRKSKSLCIFPALAWGCGYHGLALFWITGIHPMTWMGVPWLSSLLIAIFVWLFITLWGAFLVTLWSVILGFLSELKFNFNSSFISKIFNILLGTSVWCILEKIWSYSPLWWTSLSFTQSPYNLAILQLLKFSGGTIITILIVVVNLLLAEGLLHLTHLSSNRKLIKNSTRISKYNFIFIAFILLVTSHLLGYFQYLKPIYTSINNQIEIGIIQGNIPNEIKLYPQGWRDAIEGYTKGYKILAQQKVGLIITPETALPFYYNEIQSNSSFYKALLTEKIPTILGAFGTKNKSFTNSLFAINSSGKVISKYDKVNLVPLGEYIPFYSILGNIIDRLSPLDAHLIAGTKNQVFNTPFGQAIVGICYDSAFSENFRQQAKMGGEFIITASNNAHYSSTMPAQHHGQDIMRAIETNRWMARATNTGYSAIVNPHGDTIWISSLNHYQVQKGVIYTRKTQTLYVKWGDWLIKICLIFLLAYIGLRSRIRDEV